MKKTKIVLAFSGGLDTSFCIVHLREKYNAEVVTVTVDTGGFARKELAEIARQSKKLGAARHYAVDGKKQVFESFVSYLIKGNILRGGVYPLSVGAERVVQAAEVARIAVKEKADAIAHGSTGAGNDQVRFDLAFSVMIPGIKIIAPIRDLNISREDEISYLNEKGFPINKVHKEYSVNSGLWGTTIGGGCLHDSWQSPPDEVFSITPVEKSPNTPGILEIGFEKGIPVKINSRQMGGVDLVTALNHLGSRHGIGKGIHLGDTILGIKGRIGFESPAPIILVKAHQELEKLVLTRWQVFWKDHLSNFWGDVLHSGLYFDPVAKDIMAMIDSSQETVTGTVRVKLFKGNVTVVGCKSPYSMMDRSIATYGEGNLLWDGRDARGFCKIYGLQSVIARKAREKGDRSK
ncbi:argininosuccinate synthase [Candidatus Woesearchaeota archaeon]|nr:argininosuccinate synthase [Candidatus Woesearchaeota archaeon]